MRALLTTGGVGAAEQVQQRLDDSGPVGTPAGKSGPGNVVICYEGLGKGPAKGGEDGAASWRRRSRTRSCRSGPGGQRGLRVVAPARDVAARPVPDGQRLATAGSAPLPGGVERAGGPAGSAAAAQRAPSGQAWLGA